MHLSSPAFENQQTIPKIYTCDGQHISPPLVIDDVSPFAKSLAIIMKDSDAPGGTGTHWTLWNIPAKNMTLKEGMVPDRAIEGVTSFDKSGYNGPCPPKGTGVHHYRFTLYALKRMLPLDDAATVAEVEKAMEEHILECATLVGLYSKD